MFSDESNKLETYIYTYNGYVRTKQINLKNTNLFVDLPIWNIYKTGSFILWFNPRSRHIKDFKNGTWYLLA